MLALLKASRDLTPQSALSSNRKVRRRYSCAATRGETNDSFAPSSLEHNQYIASDRINMNYCQHANKATAIATESLLQ